MCGKRLCRAILCVVVVVMSYCSYLVVRFQPPKSSFSLRSTVSDDKFSFDEERAVDLFAESLSFRTLSIGKIEHDYNEFVKLYAFLESNFPLVHTKLERINVPNATIFRWPGKDSTKKALLFLAHSDVVPADAGRWSHPPFAKTIVEEDGEVYVYGRGAYDNKNDLMGVLQALEILLENNFVPEQDIYFASGEDEEQGGTGSARMNEYFLENDIHFRFGLDEGGIITRGVYKKFGVLQDVAVVGITEKGFMDVTLYAECEGGHSSTPPINGESCVSIIAKAVAKLEKFKFPARLNDATNAILRTTMIATMISGGNSINSIPSNASATINIRIHPSDGQMEDIRQIIEKVVADERVKIIVGYEISRDTTPKMSCCNQNECYDYFVLKSAIEDVFEDTFVSPFIMVGGSDLNFHRLNTDNSYNFSPMLMDFAPEKNDIARMHGIDERLTASGFVKAVKFYRRLIINLNYET